MSVWSSDVCSSGLRLQGYHRISEVTKLNRCLRRDKDDQGVGDRFLVDIRIDNPGRSSQEMYPPCSWCWPADARNQYRQPTPGYGRSEEHTSELQSLMRISYAVFCLKKKKNKQ